HEHGPILLERQTRPKIERLTSPSENALFADQVTLLADGLAQSRRQPGRVHDRVIRALVRVSPFLFFNVQLPRPVTTLATDGVAVENRFLIMVQRVLNGAGMIAMAKQAVSRNRPAGKEKLVESGR